MLDKIYVLYCIVLYCIVFIVLYCIYCIVFRIGALRKTKRLAASGDSKSIKVMREIPKRFIKAVDDKDVENRLSDQARNLKIRGQWYP